MGDAIVESPRENVSVKNKMGLYDEKWLEENEAKLSKRINDEKGENIYMSRIENWWKNNTKECKSLLWLFTETINGIYSLWEILAFWNLQYCVCKR